MHKQVLEVAPQGVAGVSGSTEGRADEGKARFAESVSGGSTTPEMAGSRSVTLGRSVLRDAVVTCHRGQCSPNRASGYQIPSADSQISPFPSDDRFADNIARYVDGKLAEDGDDECIVCGLVHEDDEDDCEWPDSDEDDESADSATSREMYQSQFGDGGRYL